MLDIFGTNGEQITSNRTVVLQKNDENIVGRSGNQQGGHTKIWNGAEDYENHKEETDGVLGTCYEEEGLEDQMLTERVNGKRSRGRQRLTYLDGLSKWMTEQVDETEKSQVVRLQILRTAKDRELWAGADPEQI